LSVVARPALTATAANCTADGENRRERAWRASTCRSQSVEPATKNESTSGRERASRHTFNARRSWRATVHGGSRLASPTSVVSARGAAKKRSRSPGGTPVVPTPCVANW
jgi:hypothetical protein